MDNRTRKPIEKPIMSRFNMRVKKIHKGQVAELGTFFLLVSFKRGKRKYSSVVKLKGNSKSKGVEEVALDMYKNICAKYSIQE